MSPDEFFIVFFASYRDSMYICVIPFIQIRAGGSSGGHLYDARHIVGSKPT